MSGSLIGGQTCDRYSAPWRECWPEERLWRAAVLGRSRGGRRWLIFLDFFLRRESACPEVIVSSDEAGAHRKTGCALETSSCERMFAGGGSMAGCGTLAKPPWSEVIVFRDVFLRQRIISPGESPPWRTIKQVAEIP